MLYKVRYDYGNEYQRLIMSAVISSSIRLTTDQEVKDFMNIHIHNRAGEYVKEIFDWDELNPMSVENALILRKVGT